MYVFMFTENTSELLVTKTIKVNLQQESLVAHHLCSYTLTYIPLYTQLNVNLTVPETRQS